MKTVLEAKHINAQIAEFIDKKIDQEKELKDSIKLKIDDVLEGLV